MTVKRPKNADGKERVSLAATIGLSYSVFLLLCLTLAIFLYSTSTRNARQMFWQQTMSRHESHVQTMDSYLSAMDSYTRQLLNDSTFIRFSNMRTINDKGAMYAAYTTMQTLAARLYSWGGMPIAESHIYLKNLGYIISAGQFTEAEQYYRRYRVFTPGKYQDFIVMLTSATAKGENVDVSPFTGTKGDYFYVRDVDSLLNRSVPAAIWFEWDESILHRMFLESPNTSLIVLDDEGKQQLFLTADGVEPEVATLSFDRSGLAFWQDNACLKAVSAFNGWSYLYTAPQSICAKALGNYDLLFWAMLAMALLGGVGIVAVLVRRNMRPIERLGSQLEEARESNELLSRDLERQKPLVCRSYTRMLLSGHITSQQEFSFMMQELGYGEPGLTFYALFLTAYNQWDTALARNDLNDLMSEAIERYFQFDLNTYFYSTTTLDYVVLTAFSPDVADPLMELQRSALRLHDDMAKEHSLWVCAGVGQPAARAINMWESFEQARAAVKYATKDHVFIPYEMIQKDSASVYYPVEISAKLYHFITTGNKAQVSEMFSLIHRENIVERSLPDQLLDFLLSDLKNTLLKARFSIPSPTEEQRERLSKVDGRLGSRLTLALCENEAVELCGFFADAAEPSDPIPEVRRYVQAHFMDSAMCLSLLSEQFHISESYLSHLFKERTGCNFSVYLEDLRLNEAMKRLRGGSGTLQDLYEDLGYNNATTFRRAFKKKFGVPPSTMRAQS